MTALLLSCGIVLDDPAVNEAVIARMKQVEEAANQIKTKLALSGGRRRLRREWRCISTQRSAFS